jgi:lipopolysaccharide biosynthesis regulator YciM
LKTVYSSLNPVEVHHLRNLLAASGIRSAVRNEDLVRLFGEMPFPECAVQLLVERAEDYPRAEALVRDFLGPGRRSGPSWRCETCGETSEAQFTACWSCGEERRPASL